MGPFLFGQKWFAKFTLPIMKGSVSMGTYIYIGIMFIIVLGICSGIFNENSCEEAWQEYYNSTEEYDT